MEFEPPEKRLDYRQEAQTIRAMAMGMKNQKVREQLFLIASLYDKLAELSDSPDSPPQMEGMAGKTDAV
jgi:hypothetical protein